MNAAILKGKAGTDDQVLHRAGDQNLTSTRVRKDPRTDMDGEAGDVRFHQFALTRVHTGPNLETKRPNRVADGERTTNRAGWSVESR